jgi:hypothetical protein
MSVEDTDLQPKRLRPITRGELLLAAFGVVSWLISCWLIYSILHLLILWCVAQTWVPAKATVLSARLEASNPRIAVRSGGVRRRGVGYSAKSTFEYQWDGKRHVGQRVWLAEFGNFFAGFQKAFGNELIEHARSGQPTICFVNPRMPDEAILFRHVPSEVLTLLALLAIVTGGVGFVFMPRRLPNLNEVKQVFPEQPWRWLPEWFDDSISPRSGHRLNSFWVAAGATTLPANIAALHEVIVHHVLLGAHCINVGFTVATCLGFHYWFLRWRFGNVKLVIEDRDGRSDKISGCLLIDKRFAEVEEVEFRLECRVWKRIRKSGETDIRSLITHVDRLRARVEKDLSGNVCGRFCFLLPSGLPNSFHESFYDQTLSKRQQTEWTLHVSGAKGFFQPRASFFVPVFRQRPTAEQKQRDLIDFHTKRNDPATLLREEGLLVDALENGSLRIHVPRQLRWKQKILTVTAAAGLLAGALFISSFNLPLAIPMLCAGLLFVIISLLLLLQTETIELHEEYLTATLSYLPFRQWSATACFSDIKQVRVIDRPGKELRLRKHSFSGLAMDPQMQLTTTSGEWISLCHQVSLVGTTAIQAMILQRLELAGTSEQPTGTSRDSVDGL